MRRRSRKRSTPASCNPSRRAVIKAPLFGQTWALLRLLGELGLPPVITRMSELFLRTLRDDPADAEVASHKLLIRPATSGPSRPGCTAGYRSACECCAT